MPVARDLRFVTAALIAAAGLCAAPFLIAHAPLERVMGPIQKIFYFHVPVCWLLMLSTLVLGGASLRFLWHPSARSDALALAAGELGVVFGIGALLSGPLWARVAWGKFWTWDARQTTTLLLFFILLAYLLARRYGGPAAHKLAAALGLFAAADVPLVYLSATWWRTLHPTTQVIPTLDARMRPALYGSFAVLLTLWGVLLALRLRLAALHADIEALSVRLDERDENAR